MAVRFGSFPEAAAAADSLRSVGFGNDEMQVFYVNAPGQHGLYPIGGDEATDRDARRMPRGAVLGLWTGMLVGAVAGLILAPYLGASRMLAALLGVGLGAYLGSLAGAMWASGAIRAGDRWRVRLRRRTVGRETGPEMVEEADERPRQAGVLLALKVERPEAFETAGQALARHPALHVEVAEGRWENGCWSDFDPLTAPLRVLHSDDSPRS